MTILSIFIIAIGPKRPEGLHAEALNPAYPPKVLISQHVTDRRVPPRGCVQMAVNEVDLQFEHDILRNWMQRFQY